MVVKRTALRPMSAKRRALGPAHAVIREAVFARDGHRCWVEKVALQGYCGPCFGGLTVHHLKKASAGGEYTLENLLSLCARHNGWVEENPDKSFQLGLVQRRGTSERSKAQQALLPATDEYEWQRRVIATAKANGWLVSHSERAQVRGRWITNTARGFPDLVLVHAEKKLVLFIELKRNRKAKLRPDQLVWMLALQACTVEGSIESYVVAPEDERYIVELLTHTPDTVT